MVIFRRLKIKNLSLKYRRIGLSAREIMLRDRWIKYIMLIEIFLQYCYPSEFDSLCLGDLSLFLKLKVLKMLVIDPIQMPRLTRKIHCFADVNHNMYHVMFRFRNLDQLRRLKTCLRIDEVVVIDNTLRVSGELYLLLGLYRLSHPCRLIDMEIVFGLQWTSCSKVISHFVQYVCQHYSHLVLNNIAYWRDKMQTCAAKIDAKMNSILRLEERRTFNVFAFIDNCLYASNRPGGGPMENGERNDNEIQRAFYSGWKKCHGLKWQTIDLPCGMTFHCWGGVSMKHSDIWTLANSNIIPQLEALQAPFTVKYKLFGDSAYAWTVHVTSKKNGTAENPLTEVDDKINEAINACRQSIEWSYRDNKIYWGQMHDRFRLKLRESAVADMVLVTIILKNAFVCLNGCQTATYFDMMPPSLEDWMQLQQL